MNNVRLNWLAALCLMTAGWMLPTAGCGDDGALVGIRCAAGFTACGHVCVDLRNDPSHCGSCDNQCAAAVSCVLGICGGPSSDAADGKDGASSESSDGNNKDVGISETSDGNGNDGGSAETSDGSGGSGSSASGDATAEDDSNGSDPDASDSGGQAGQDSGSGDEVLDPDADSGPGCQPPYDNALNCGACAVACMDPMPICKPDSDAGFVCAPLCDPPLVQCGYECKDLQSDEANCGACGNVCLTGLCVTGKCMGLAVGHIVLMGMDFSTWYAGSPPARLFSNAVFLPAHNPLRVLMYSEFGDKSATGSVPSVMQLLDYSATQNGRSYSVTDAGAFDQLQPLLDPSAQDVLLIMDQPSAPAGLLTTIGESWKGPLLDYVRAGGVVVVLMSTFGQNDMADLLTGAGLGEVDSLQDITVPSHVLSNTAPADAIGINVISPFLARPRTATLHSSMTPSLETVFVVKDATHPDAGPSDPVVIHRVLLPNP